MNLKNLCLAGIILAPAGIIIGLSYNLGGVVIGSIIYGIFALFGLIAITDT